MLGRTPFLVALALTLGTTAAARGQLGSFDDPPRPYQPKQPPARKDVDRRASLKQYALGILCIRDDRLLEALQALEEAAKLDPEAAGIFKAQVPVLLALDRGRDALAACQKVVALDPEDVGAWGVLARMQRAVGRDDEARQALRQGLATRRVKERPDLAQQMYLELGGLCEAAGEFAAAAEAFHRAAELLDDPDALPENGVRDREAIVRRAAETYERIGNLYRQAKQYDRAIAAYREAQKRLPDRAGRLNFNLAQLSRERGDHAKALEDLDAYLRLQPSGTEAYELKIDLLRKLGREREVLPWLERGTRADQHNVGLHRLLAREYANAKQTAKAEQAYQRLAASAPSVELYRDLFRLYKDDPFVGVPKVLERLNEAIGKAAAPDGGGAGAAQAKAMVGALRDDGELARELVQVAFKAGDAGMKFETLHFLAALADKHRKHEEAEKFYRACLPYASRSNEALIYGGLLRVLLRAHKYEDALRVCQEGLRKAQATNRLLFYTDMARAQAGLDRFDEALRTCDRALDLAGDDNKLLVRHLKVRVLLMAERYADAENECQAMLKQTTQPGDALEVRYLLSNVYSATKQYEKSEEQLQLVLKADPSNATACNDLGYGWAERGKNLAEAEELIRRALELDRRQRQTGKATAGLDEDNAAYLDSLGWVLFRQGKIGEARKELERAAKLPDGEDPVIWDHLGDVYYRLELNAEARRAWEQALRLYDQGRRRRDDERYRDVQRKVQLVSPR